MWVKWEPNSHEEHLMVRGQKYIKKLSKIPGVEMISIVNSLSMYATHKESDIDLFIVTKPGMIWFVRFFSTVILWSHWVWRRNEDIAGNFCLSFFITTEAMDISQIAIENDIYLYYWIYYMKPIYIQGNIYERFLGANNWVEVNDVQKERNKKYMIKNHSWFASLFYEFWEFWYKIRDINTWIFYRKINNLIRHFLLPKTLKTYHTLGEPEGVIISDTMLKFHDQDKRRIIRDRLR